ncbi:MAG: T9SS type A sorting domain-containing protein, partial [Opitutaceae bacterium]|nr:T9SS type A sorting domain-containing protein [Cytophagales bacterium]
LNASSNSPGKFSYSLLEGNSITVSDTGIVSVLKPGNSIVQVIQEASPPFLSGTQQVSVNVYKVLPHTTITSAKEVGIGEKIQLSATSTPPGAFYKWSIVSQYGTNSVLNTSELLVGPTSGTINIKAEIIEDEYFTAVSSTSSFTTQIITVKDTSGIPAINFYDKYADYGDYSFSMPYTTNSPGQVTFSIINGDAAIISSEGLVEIKKTGEVTVLLNQDSSGSFSAITKTAKIIIGKAYPYGYISSTNKVGTNGKILLSVTSNPPGAKYTFAIVYQNGTNAIIDSNELLAGPNAGTLNIKAELIVDENFALSTGTSTYINQTITVEPTAGTPEIVLNDIQKSYGDYPFNLEAVSNSPGKISFKIIEGTAVTLNEDTLHTTITIKSTGVVTIEMQQEASPPFNSATKQVKLFVDKAYPVSVITSANKIGVGKQLNITVKSFPPGAKYNITINSQSGTQSAISGSTLSAGPSTGTLDIKAEVIEDENFTTASSTYTFTSQIITVQSSSGVPEITFGNLSKNYGDQPFYLNVNSNSTGKISFSVLEGIAATITPQGLVTIQKPGVVKIQAYQEASGPYEAVTYNTLLTVNDIVTGLIETQQEIKYAAYPNPVKDFLNIPKSSLMNCNHSFKIYNMQGEIQIQSNEESQADYLTVNMTSLLPGLYLLKTYACGKETNQKIVKE